MLKRVDRFSFCTGLGGRTAYATLLFGGLCSLTLSTLTGCTSATIVPQDDDPRVTVVDGRGEYGWDADEGWLQPEAGDWGEVESIRREANEAYEAQAYADALSGYLALRGRLREEDPGLTQAHFSIAECYYYLGHYEKAIENYRKVYREGKPEEGLAEQTRQRVYDIAMDFLKGKAACSTLGFRYTCPRHGIELLVGDDGLITEYPYLSFADAALMEIGRYYYDNKQYPEAVPIYERVVRDYSGPGFSTWTGTAQFQLGLSWYMQIRGADYDEKIISQARKEFRRYLEIERRGPHTQKAREHLHEISEMLAAKYLRIAKFYLRESDPRAAEVYLRLLLDEHTNSSAAREARDIQRQLDKLAVGG